MKKFTLLELLIVIAIIGILASVVLASLNTARDKGSSAAIKSTVNNLRAQAELYYDDNGNSYAGMCDTDTEVGIALAQVDTQNGAGAIVCVDGSDVTGAWAIESALVPADEGFYCVDSSGAATTTPASSIEIGVSADAVCAGA